MGEALFDTAAGRRTFEIAERVGNDVAVTLDSDRGSGLPVKPAMTWGDARWTRA